MFKILLVFLIMTYIGLSTEADSCEECQSWYDTEKNDLGWLVKLNREFKCPCRAKLGRSGMKEIDNPSNKKWKKDFSCRTPKSSGCAKYHPGAAGCLRSVGHTDDGAAQQCCYGENGKLLKAGSPGAGTPDRQYATIFNLFLAHRKADVIPYQKCCEECTRKSYCDYYVNGVRKGDDTHCPK